MPGRGIPEPSERLLPPGPHRNLVLAVHALYRDAGLPGLREIAATLLLNDDYPGSMNHELVANFLHGRTLSSLHSVRALAMALADLRRPAGDRQEAQARIGQMWQEAKMASLSRGQPEPRPAFEVPHAVVLVADEPAAPEPGLAVLSPTEPAAASVEARPATRSKLQERIADLVDARAAHGGLPIEQVEAFAARIISALTELLQQQIAETGLPINVSSPLVLDCTFADLPYRVPTVGNNALMVTGTFQRPLIRLDMTFVVGIARDREEELAFVVFDATVQGGDPVRLTLDYVRGEELVKPGSILDGWVEGKICRKLEVVSTAARADVTGNR